MTDARPLISVVIPVYNGARFLAQALDSVFAQTYTALEVIVVDDESPDGSRRIAERYPVTLLGQKHAGGGVARNTGIAASRGELIALLDQDDVWLPEKLARQVEFLRRHPAVAGALAAGERFLEPGVQEPDWFGIAGAPGSPSGWLIKRTAFAEVGEFDGSSMVPDFDWLLRARDLGLQMRSPKKPLFRYRVHEANSMHRRDELRASMFVAFKRSVDRTAGRSEAVAR